MYFRVTVYTLLTSQNLKSSNFKKDNAMSPLQQQFYAALAQLQQHTDLDDEATQDAVAALAQLIEDHVE
jgi:hypothetical protein